MPEFAPIRSAVLRVIAAATRPLDAYALARLTGNAPMEVGRTLVALEQAGEVRSDDPSDTANDLARTFVPA